MFGKKDGKEPEFKPSAPIVTSFKAAKKPLVSARPEAEQGRPAEKEAETKPVRPSVVKATEHHAKPQTEPEAEPAKPAAVKAAEYRAKPQTETEAEPARPAAAKAAEYRIKPQSAPEAESGQELPAADADTTENETLKTDEAPQTVRSSVAEDPIMGSKRVMIFFAAACAVIIAVLAIALPILYDAAANDVTVNDNGFKVNVTAPSGTVASVLDGMGITVSEYDYLDSAMDDEIYDGMQIVIHRAMQVYVNSDGGQLTVNTISGTVADALTLAGVTVDGDDEIYPSETEYLTPGMIITHIDVERQTVVDTEQLGYGTVTKNDSTIWEGDERTVVDGEPGLLEVTTQVTYKNGIEMSREQLSSDMIVAPIDEVIAIGTMEFMDTRMGRVGPNGKLMTVPTRSQIYSDSLKEHKDVARPDSKIIAKTLVARYVTAYSGHTQSSSGRRPQIGTISCYYKILPQNTKIFVPGYGYGVVEDQGGNTNVDHLDLDLFMENKSQCSSWGRKRNLTFYVLK